MKESKGPNGKSCDELGVSEAEGGSLLERFDEDRATGSSSRKFPGVAGTDRFLVADVLAIFGMLPMTWRAAVWSTVLPRVISGGGLVSLTARFYGTREVSGCCQVWGLVIVDGVVSTNRAASVPNLSTGDVERSDKTTKSDAEV